MAAAATGTDEPVWPADPVQVVQALPVLIEPGTQLRVGARVVPPGRRAHAGYSTLQEYLNGDPILRETAVATRSVPTISGTKDGHAGS
jgi:hypothetical protein